MTMTAKEYWERVKPHDPLANMDAPLDSDRLTLSLYDRLLLRINGFYKYPKVRECWSNGVERTSRICNSKISTRKVRFRLKLNGVTKKHNESAMILWSSNPYYTGWVSEPPFSNNRYPWRFLEKSELPIYVKHYIQQHTSTIYNSMLPYNLKKDFGDCSKDVYNCILNLL